MFGVGLLLDGEFKFNCHLKKLLRRFRLKLFFLSE